MIWNDCLEKIKLPFDQYCYEEMIQADNMNERFKSLIFSAGMVLLETNDFEWYQKTFSMITDQYRKAKEYKGIA